MTENEKIELFDKWYDENYDEWAEGEEGIALREELEQAFKSGIATIEKENAELKKQLEMSNKVYNDNLDYSHHIEGQLTKAKEIIKGLLSYEQIPRDCLKERYRKLLEEAENFLKESEVEKNEEVQD